METMPPLDCEADFTNNFPQKTTLQINTNLSRRRSNTGAGIAGSVHLAFREWDSNSNSQQLPRLTTNVLPFSRRSSTMSSVGSMCSEQASVCSKSSHIRRLGIRKLLPVGAGATYAMNAFYDSNIPPQTDTSDWDMDSQIGLDDVESCDATQLTMVDDYSPSLSNLRTPPAIPATKYSSATSTPILSSLNRRKSLYENTPTSIAAAATATTTTTSTTTTKLSSLGLIKAINRRSNANNFNSIFPNHSPYNSKNQSNGEDAICITPTCNSRSSSTSSFSVFSPEMKKNIIVETNQDFQVDPNLNVQDVDKDVKPNIVKLDMDALVEEETKIAVLEVIDNDLTLSGKAGIDDENGAVVQQEHANGNSAMNLKLETSEIQSSLDQNDDGIALMNQTKRRAEAGCCTVM